MKIFTSSTTCASRFVASLLLRCRACVAEVCNWVVIKSTMCAVLRVIVDSRWIMCGIDVFCKRAWYIFSPTASSPTGIPMLISDISPSVMGVENIAKLFDVAIVDLAHGGQYKWWHRDRNAIPSTPAEQTLQQRLPFMPGGWPYKQVCPQGTL
jgi:hypothetical protein